MPDVKAISDWRATQDQFFQDLVRAIAGGTVPAGVAVTVAGALSSYPVYDKGGAVFDVRAYGATGNGVRVRSRTMFATGVQIGSGATGTTTAGSATFTATGAAFASTDVGRNIKITGADTAGADLYTSIKARVSNTQVTLADNAHTTIAGTAAYVYGNGGMMGATRGLGNLEDDLQGWWTCDQQGFLAISTGAGVAGADLETVVLDVQVQAGAQQQPYAVLATNASTPVVNTSYVVSPGGIGNNTDRVITVTNGSPTLADNQGTFVTADIGKNVVVRRAGTAGADLVTSIIAVGVNGASCTMATNALATITGTAVYYYDSGCSMTAGSAVLTDPAGVFTVADVGKVMTVRGAMQGQTAGCNVFTLITTIASVQSLTRCTLAAPATQTVRMASYTYGTDDTTAVQAAMDACVAAGGGMVQFPTGVYCVNTGLIINGSNLTLIGAGHGASIITFIAGQGTAANALVKAQGLSNIALLYLGFDVNLLGPKALTISTSIKPPRPDHYHYAMGCRFTATSQALLSQWTVQYTDNSKTKYVQDIQFIGNVIDLCPTTNQDLLTFDNVAGVVCIGNILRNSNQSLSCFQSMAGVYNDNEIRGLRSRFAGINAGGSGNRLQNNIIWDCFLVNIGGQCDDMSVSGNLFYETSLVVGSGKMINHLSVNDNTFMAMTDPSVVGGQAGGGPGTKLVTLANVWGLSFKGNLLESNHTNHALHVQNAADSNGVPTADCLIANNTIRFSPPSGNFYGMKISTDTPALALMRSDGIMLAGSTTLTQTGGTFLIGDVGKGVVVIGAGDLGTPLVNTINAFIDANNVTLATKASQAVNSAVFYYGQAGGMRVTGNIIDCMGGAGSISTGQGVLISGPNIDFNDNTVRNVKSTQNILFEDAAALSDNNTYLDNNFTTTGLFTFVGTQNVIRGNRGLNPKGALSTPLIPASTVVLTNQSGFDVTVLLSTGAAAVTSISIGGTATAVSWAAGGTYTFWLPANQNVALTYAGGAMTWQWYAD